MFTGLQNIFRIPELRKRIIFSLLMLAVYRVGAHIPTPGVRGDALSQYLHQAAGGLMGFFDMFSGGALSKVTIFALGIMPYITASIVLQLLTVVVPRLQALAKEGEAGRKKITEYEESCRQMCGDTPLYRRMVLSGPATQPRSHSGF